MVRNLSGFSSDLDVSLFSSLQKNAPFGLAFFDDQKRYVRVNQYLQKINGLSEKEHIGKTVEDLHPSVADRLNKCLNQVLRTRRSVKSVRLSAPDKRDIHRDWLLNFYPLKDREEKLFIAMLAHDVSKMAELERQLEKHEAHTHTILEVLSSGIIELDGNFHQLYANVSAMELFQNTKYTNTDLYSERHRRIKKKDRPEYKVLKTQKHSATCVAYLRHSKWGRVWVQVTARKMPDSNTIAISITDITGQKELELKKEEFISLASHELKTPITSIGVYAQLLEHHLPINAKTKDIHSKLTNQLWRVKSLIEELLDATRMRIGSFKPVMAPFAAHHLLSGLVKEFTLLHPNHTFLLQKNPRLIAYGDRKRTYQALTNIFMNAVKYSEPSEKIIIESSSKDGKVKIQVKDRGIGIDKEVQKNVFKHFYHDQDEYKTYPGLGLGLYIAERFIFSMGGSISVQSKKGKGSTFTVELKKYKKKTS